MFTDYLCIITQNLFIFHAVQRTFEHRAHDELCVCTAKLYSRYGIANSFNLGNFLHPKKKHIYQTTVIFFTMNIVKWNPIKLSVSRWYIFQRVSNLGHIHNKLIHEFLLSALKMECITRLLCSYSIILYAH